MLRASIRAASSAFCRSGASAWSAFASGLGVAGCPPAPFELCQAAFKLGQAAAEFPHTASASIRCCGSGRGPRRRGAGEGEWESRWKCAWELAWELAGDKAGSCGWRCPRLRPRERRIGGHQLQRLGQQGGILAQRRQVILPEIQELARQGLQLLLLVKGWRWAGGMLRVGSHDPGHDSSGFPSIIGGRSSLSQCSYCIAKEGGGAAMLHCIQGQGTASHDQRPRQR
jgi:hypothetical protein